MRKLIILVGIFLLSYSMGYAEPVEVQPPQQKILSSPSGRYVFGQISRMSRDQYLLDTLTGRLWQMTVSEIDGEKITYMSPVPFDSESVKKLELGFGYLPEYYKSLPPLPKGFTLDRPSVPK